MWDIALIIGHLQQYALHFNEHKWTAVQTRKHVPEVVRCLGKCGRPAFAISQDQLEGLLELGFSFTRIAEVVWGFGEDSQKASKSVWLAYWCGPLLMTNLTSLLQRH